MKIDRKKYRIIPVNKKVNVYMTLNKSFICIDHIDTKNPVVSVYINVNDDMSKRLKKVKEYLSSRVVKEHLGEHSKLCFDHMLERL